jgi:hypothetical protein
MSANDVMRKRVKRKTGKACCDKRYYVVKYDGNDPAAQGGQQDPTYYRENTTVRVFSSGTITLVGYAFVSWNTKPNGSGKTYQPGDAFTIIADTFLYAQWRPVFQVLYDTNNVNAIGGQVDPVLYSIGDTVTVLDQGTIYSTVFGYVFSIWQDGEGVYYTPGDTFVLTGNITLYANYLYSPDTYDPSGLPSDYFVPMRRSGSLTSAPVTVYNALSVATHTISLPAKVLNNGFLTFTQSGFFYDGASTRQFFPTIARASDFTTYVASTITLPSTIYNADDTTTFTSGHFGGNDVILTKYSVTGQAEWVASVHSDGGGAETMVNVETDPFNNAYVYGTHITGNDLKAYNADGTLYPITIDSTLGEAFNGFIVKYSPNGFVLGVASLQGASNQIFNKAVVDASYVYIAGNTFTNVVPNFVNGAATFALNDVGISSSEGFILKLSGLGDSSPPVWYVRVTSTGIDVGASVAVDSTGNIFGMYTSNIGASIDFYDAGDVVTIQGTAVNTIANSRLTALAKYDSNGMVQWVAAFNTANVVAGQQRLTVDASGNSYVMIRSSSSILVTDSMGTTTLAVPPTFSDVNFFIKLDPNGVYVDSAIITQSLLHKVTLLNNTFYVDYIYNATTTNGITTIFYGATQLDVGEVGKPIGSMLLKFTPTLVPSVVGFCAQ